MTEGAPKLLRCACLLRGLLPREAAAVAQPSGAPTRSPRAERLAAAPGVNDVLVSAAMEGGAL
jgi:hypothetical protein